MGRLMQDMVSSVYPDFSVRSLQEISTAILDVGMHREPTRQDALRIHREILGQVEASLREPETPRARPGRMRGVAGRLLARVRDRSPLLVRPWHAGQARLADTRKTRLIEQQRLSMDLLGKALDDPELAAVFDTFDREVDDTRRRQYLFANAMYANVLFAWRLELITKEELFGYLRGMLQNPIFREYWDASRGLRASLPATSDEAEVGRMTDQLITDLDEADTDEWWIVGHAPDE
ncbi:DUF6082 family protein [Streptomyces sp. PU_AKi4]|uniref:DUF6082 family protein n=1 Tax=Streptomyces sp. PU_AKi4 TaxID=2800809 RepID=UPI003525332E